MPTVVLNGEERMLPDGATAADAARACGGGHEDRGVAVAVDGHVLSRAEWDRTPLHNGAHV